MRKSVGGLLLLAALWAGCAGSPPPGVESGRYTDTANGYSVLLPDGWEPRDSLPAGLEALLPALRGGSGRLVLEKPDTGSVIVAEAAAADIKWFAFKLSSPESRHHKAVADLFEGAGAAHRLTNLDQRLHWDALSVTHSAWMLQKRDFSPERFADFSFDAGSGAARRRLIGEAFAYPCHGGRACRLTVCLFFDPEGIPSDRRDFQFFLDAIRGHDR